MAAALLPSCCRLAAALLPPYCHLAAIFRSIAATLLSIAAALLPHCCLIDAALLLHCCRIAAHCCCLFEHCCRIFGALLPHCCRLAAALLLCCCRIAAALLPHYCRIAAVFLSIVEHWPAARTEEFFSLVFLNFASKFRPTSFKCPNKFFQPFVVNLYHCITSEFRGEFDLKVGIKLKKLPSISNFHFKI